MRYKKLIIILSIINVVLLATPFAMAAENVKKTVNVKKKPVTKSVTIKKDSKPVKKTVTVKKPTVKKNVRVECNDCEKEVVKKVEVAKPKTVVKEKIVKTERPVSKVEVRENTDPIEQCYEEIGNSGVYSFCGEDVPIAIKPINGDGKKVITKDEKENENNEVTEDENQKNNDVEEELPRTGGSTQAMFSPLSLIPFGYLLKKRLVKKSKYPKFA